MTLPRVMFGIAKKDFIGLSFNVSANSSRFVVYSTVHFDASVILAFDRVF
jgi:hypothetical protein